jgi:transcriptional antiterminator RfaH
LLHSIAERGLVSPQEPRWYCARSKPGQEGIAVDCLKRQDFTPYFPKITIERAKNGRIVRDSEALFPGYLLVLLAMAPEHWRAINNTRGVAKLLGAGVDGFPTALPRGEIERLIERERAGMLFISEVVRLRRGDKVRIRFGWAVDQIGSVVSTKGERINLLVGLLGAQCRVIAPQHALELVQRAPQIRRSARAEALPDFIRRPVIKSN